MKKNVMASLALAGAIMMCAACSTTKVASNFNGMTTPEGKPIAHLNTSNLALNLLLSKPLVGDASLEGTVSDFTTAAAGQRATKVHIVQSSSKAWWFVFPPFSFIITPVTSNVAGDVLP